MKYQYLIQLLSLYILQIWICSAQTNSTDGHIGICRDEVQCSGNGQCDYQGIRWRCICDDGWATFPIPNSTSSDPIYCNYEQRLQLVAFLLSFFVGWAAAGRFYCGLWLTGGLKIGLCVGLGCCGCLFVSCITGVSTGLCNCFSRDRRTDDNCCGKICALFGGCYMCVVSIGVTVWIIYDWVMFGLNEIEDENGIPLKGW